MSGWVAIGLVVIGLAGVALAVLIADLYRGDIGGGRHTMARARRLLVVATDKATVDHAESWVTEQRRERPELQCFVLVDPDGQGLFEAVQDVIDRERPDAMVMVRHEQDRHATQTGTYGRLKAQGLLPIDTIYVDGKSAP